MKYIIFNNESDAINLNYKITQSAKNNWTDEITSDYCIIRKHPTQNLWAIIIDPNYVQFFSEQEILSGQELTTDWNKIFNFG